MEIKRNRQKTLKIILIIMPVIIALAAIAHIVMTDRFNSQVHSAYGDASQDDTYMHFGGREDSTSVWKKQDYNLYGKIVDINAQTIDGTIYNKAPYKVSGWQMRINFHDDCFINNGWCGIFEIHQNVLTNEKVQTLDLRNYKIDDVTLDYLFDGDLLIHLTEGDYVIYYPSVKDSENTIEAESELTMGYILYYLDFPDLTDYEITYTYEKNVKDGPTYSVLVLLAVVWVMLLILYIISRIIYNNAVKETELVKSGIISMSDIYEVIYLVNLKKDELTPIVADKNSEKLRPRQLGANDQLQSLCDYDCTDNYREMLKEFSNLDTLNARMKDRNTIAFEYVSKAYGWCVLRFFAMDRKQDGPLEKVLIAIQVINEEKAEMERVSKAIAEAEMENRSKSVFLSYMSQAIRTPINSIIGMDTMILRESTEPEVQVYARTIDSSAKRLLSIIDGLLDITDLEAGKIELAPSNYSLKELVEDVKGVVSADNDFEKVTLSLDITEQLPDGLYGDSGRIKQAVINILSYAARHSVKGNIAVSVFGKAHDDLVHLLVSVKNDTMELIPENEEETATPDLSLNLVRGILGLMNSELQVISREGEGGELYFELEQKVVSSKPVGKINTAASKDDDNSYKASFTAPDARILVVDDNKMNLEVMECLLKANQVKTELVSSGSAALEHTMKTRYDLILMDHLMPEMDGVEAMKKIKSQGGGKNRTTPIVAVTSNVHSGAEAEYKTLGFADYIPKPVFPDVLESTIAKHIDKSKIVK